MKNNKFIGAYIPQDLLSYLALYCRYPGINRSILLRSVLKEWIDKKETELPVYALIKDWQQILQLKWEARKLNAKSPLITEFNLFRNDWVKKLQGQGIDEMDIKNIMRGLTL